MKSFNEVYTKICTENYKSIHTIRKKHLIRSFLIVSIFILISIPIALNFSLLLALTFDIVITLVIFFSPYFNTYSNVYKANIISSLVQNYDEKLSFNATGGIGRNQYDEADFGPYTEYHSSDYIYGTLDNQINFQMCDLHTLLVSRDKDGHVYRTTTFKGLFSAIPLKHYVPRAIKIRSQNFVTAGEEKDPTKVNMDSQEFEKYFNVFADDKILAMQVLTSELLDYLLTSRKKNKIKFEITIRRNYLYIRIHCHNMFESNMFKNPLDFKTLYKYYTFLNFSVELNQKINYILENKEL